MAEEHRLARLEAELAELRPSLHERLSKLEKAANRDEAAGWLRRFVAWMGDALPSLITSLVVAVVGFSIKDSVDLAIKQRELQLSYVKEMKEQLVAMATERDPEAVKRAAVLIAAFGEPAVLPLMNELRFGGNRALGAEYGLSALAFMYPQAVCDGVLRVLDSPSQPLGWEGHAAAGRILAAANCGAALPILQAHAAILAPVEDGRTAEVGKLVADRPNPSQQKEWLREMRDSISRLTTARKKGRV